MSGADDDVEIDDDAEIQGALNQAKQFARELTRYRDIADDASRKAAGLSKILLGYIEMYPEFDGIIDVSAVAPVGGPPRGAEAVRLILQESPGHAWLVTELVDALRKRDWLPESDNPANAVRAALERLREADDSDVRKGTDISNRVTYTYDPDYEPPQPSSGYSPDEEPF